jgi:adenylate cyclase
MGKLDGLCEWLLDGVPGAKQAVDVADRLGGDMSAAGIALQRLGVFVTTIHPNVLGRSFIWERGKETRVGELSAAARRSDNFINSPIHWVTTHRREWRWRSGDADTGYPVITDLSARGCVDYVALPLPFLDGSTHAMTLASDAGFSDDDLAEIRRTARPLSRIAEIFALMRTASTILTTYVGQHAGERVLDGQIMRGDIEMIRAAIWFSDLRGFTTLSTAHTPQEVIAIINEVFECQVPAIERHGGEVLKFIGDGLLAIFPIRDDGESRCREALAAAGEAFAALASTKHRLGLALHVGEVAYGNIGSSTRLDFTAIGNAVNMAARLEGVASKLGRPIVMSQAFADLAGGGEDLGLHELKGIAEPQRVLAPR